MNGYIHASHYPHLRHEFPERNIVTCPRCGLPAWEPTIETAGCPICKALDHRERLYP